jgi:hypothetical protein
MGDLILFMWNEIVNYLQAVTTLWIQIIVIIVLVRI